MKVLVFTEEKCRKRKETVSSLGVTTNTTTTRAHERASEYTCVGRFISDIFFRIWFGVAKERERKRDYVGMNNDERECDVTRCDVMKLQMSKKKLKNFSVDQSKMGVCEVNSHMIPKLISLIRSRACLIFTELLHWKASRSEHFFFLSLNHAHE